MARGFWLACLRCVVRVNGVMARLIDTRFLCRADGAGRGTRVLRERSWREGSWGALAGRGAPSHLDMGGQAQEERLALERLPLVAPHALCVRCKLYAIGSGEEQWLD